MLTMRYGGVVFILIYLIMFLLIGKFLNKQLMRWWWWWKKNVNKYFNFYIYDFFRNSNASLRNDTGTIFSLGTHKALSKFMSSKFFFTFFFLRVFFCPGESFAEFMFAKTSVRGCIDLFDLNRGGECHI